MSHSGWVSVEDQLPERTDWYQVLFKEGIRDPEYYGIQDIIKWCGDRWDGYSKSDITYWRELPEPPEICVNN